MISGVVLTDGARDLADRNAALVPFVLGRHFKGVPDGDRDELLSAGYAELLAVARRYDPAAGAFSTYAVASLRLRMVQVWGELRRRRDALPCVSLDAPLTGDEGAGTVAERIADPAADTEGAALRSARAAEVWGWVVSVLTPRQAEVLLLLYVDELEPTEAAARLGVSRQRVAQVHDGALEALRRRAGVLHQTPARKPAVSPWWEGWGGAIRRAREERAHRVPGPKATGVTAAA